MENFSCVAGGFFTNWAIREARYICLHMHICFPGGTSGKEPACRAGDVRDVSSIPGSGRSPQGGNGNPLQYLTGESPWTEEPGGLQSRGLQRVRHDWGDLARTHEHTHTRTYISPWFLWPSIAQPAGASEQRSSSKTTRVSPKANTTSLLDQMGVTHSLEYLQHGTPVSRAGCEEGSFKDIEDMFPGFKELSICAP